MFLFIVIIFAILIFLSVGSKETKDMHTVYFLVALSLFGVFIWTAPRLPQVLATETGFTLWKHILLYLVFLIIIIWYIFFCCQKYFIPRFPFIKTN